MNLGQGSSIEINYIIKFSLVKTEKTDRIALDFNQTTEP